MPQYKLGELFCGSGGIAYGAATANIENSDYFPAQDKVYFESRFLIKYNGRCIITGISHPSLLVASHIKPWAVSSNLERLCVDNGLLLSTTYDKLFDSGLITFDTHGRIHLSSLIGEENISRLNLSDGASFDLNISDAMKAFLAYHSEVLFSK